MTTVIKASDSADFLTMVPLLAGYVPSRSLALVPFERGRAYGVLRMDLPSPDDDPADWADQAIAFVSRIEDVEAVAIVVYTDEEATSTRDGLVLPAETLVSHLAAVIDDTGLRLLDALCATPQGWACYLDEEPRLAPLPATPAIPEIDDLIEGDQCDGTELPAVDLAQKERVGRALLALHDAIDASLPGHSGADRIDPRAIELLQQLDDVPLLAETALEAPEDGDPFRIAALLWLLERPLFRDALLLQWIDGLDEGRRALAAQFAYRLDGAPPSDGQTARLLGAGPRPELDRLRRALRLTRTLAAHAPRAGRSGALVIAAWMSWALGRASHSDAYLAAIAAIDPDHGFAQLLGALMQSKPLPDWAFESRRDMAA